MRTSTIYTIGTALARAQGTGVSVDVLVAGQWLSGHVSALDGHGLVLHRNDGVLSVLRMESISAVQVRQAAAFEERPEVERHPADDAAHPMPAASSDARAGGSDDGDDPPSQSTVVPLPRRDPSATRSARPAPTGPVARPTVGPIVSPRSVPSEGLHTMMRSLRTAPGADATSVS
ncbi:hypothetical protein [Nocardioides sp. P5_C9_2]